MLFLYEKIILDVISRKRNQSLPDIECRYFIKPVKLITKTQINAITCGSESKIDGKLLVLLLFLEIS